MRARLSQVPGMLCADLFYSTHAMLFYAMLDSDYFALPHSKLVFSTVHYSTRPPYCILS